MKRKQIYKSPLSACCKAADIARQFSIRFVRPSIFCLCVPVLGVLMIGGCPQKPVHAKFTQTGVIVPPRVIPRNVDVTPPTIDFTYEAPELILVLTIPTPKAPPVHRTPYPVEPEPEVKPEAPRISPQLSPEAKNKAQGNAEADIRAAQQSLDSTAGRKLDANQQDLSDKINSFMKQAREAIAAEDWLRAQSLAHKAKVLGDGLTQSF